MGLIAFFCFRLSEEMAVIGVELESVLPLFLCVTTFTAVGGVFLMYNGLQLSHRIAGPGYRFCQSIQQIRAGDVEFESEERAIVTQVVFQDGEEQPGPEDGSNEALWVLEDGEWRADPGVAVPAILARRLRFVPFNGLWRRVSIPLSIDEALGILGKNS